MAAAKKKESTNGVLSRLVDIKGAAAYLGVSPWTVRDLIWDRRLKILRVGKKQMIDQADLDQYIDSNKSFI